MIERITAKTRRRKGIGHLMIWCSLIFLAACSSPVIPKPEGYFRIDFPEKSYRRFDSIYPYTFEIPPYARVIPDRDPQAEPFWCNLDFPRYHGRLHLSYKSVHGNLNQYLEDCRSMVNKHIPKADAIEEEVFHYPDRKVSGSVFRIQGVSTASAYQFFLTDSSQHFLRGALYFSARPNNDSLSPVIDFIGKDIDHLIQTLRWK